jgi:hypothetical protein
MARSDSIGFFWQDMPVAKPPKAEKPKRTPPERTWERPDYLPGLEQARVFPVPLFTDHELVQSCINRERLIYDIEVYQNYFLAAFTSVISGKVIYFEMTPDKGFDVAKMLWVMQNFTTVGFNSINFDLPITALALAGKPCALLKHATNQIILEGARPSDVLKQYKVRKLQVDHIDLIEVAPLRASLKIYGGRLHAPKMQDLPFHPETFLSEDQITIVRWYCVNDLTDTAILYQCLKEQIDLRETLSSDYGMDLRSKSDAQIAEAVIADEVAKLNGMRAQKPVIDIGTRYKYKIPAFLKYESPLMNWALNVVRNADFVVSEDGNIGMPPELKELNLQIAGGVYRMGIGGLHSSEQCVKHEADDHTVIVDRDVTSYYPQIILNQGLYPHHLGPNFLRVYAQLVGRRLAAKAAGNKVIADSLKITINGSFGKLGNKYSVLYSPDLLIQVTVTGQLSLLMLIERLEIRGIQVVSANTDGIVIKCPKVRHAEMEGIIAQWERDTGFQTEETAYRAIYSRDVNNYIAIKPDGTTKNKGAYANPWADKKNLALRLHKNPTNQICVEAVEAFLTKGVPILQTIRECKDIRKFVSVRTVKGGAVKDGQYLGKSIRWYYATEQGGEMVYASNGNKVPRSDGAMPLLELPEVFPDNVDYDRYEVDAYRILSDVGYQASE